MTNKILGASTVSGFLGESPDWSNLSCPTGRTLQSVWSDGTVQFWGVSDTQEVGGQLLADGNYANPTNVQGNSLPDIAGYFVDGFVFENPNQVGVDASGNSWQYVGTSPLPYTVPELTVPSAPDYEKVFESTASNVTTSSGGSVQDYINENLTPFESVADMRAYDYSSINADSRIEWQGYYSQSDGGSNWGVLRKGDSTLLVDDGGSIFVIVDDSVNGVWVEANLKGGLINVKKFGAKGDGTTPDASAVQSAIDKSDGIRFPSGSFLIEKSLDLTDRFAGFNIKGNGRGKISNSRSGTILLGGTGQYPIIDLGGTQQCTLSNFVITSADTNPSESGIHVYRTTTSQYAQFNVLDKVTIDLQSNPSANGGLGTVGISNVAAEIFTFRDVYSSADTGAYIGSTNVFNIPSLYKALGGPTSCSTFWFEGTNTFRSYDAVGHPLRFQAVTYAKGMVYTKGFGASEYGLFCRGSCREIYMEVFVETSLHFASIDSGMTDCEIKFVGTLNENRYIDGDGNFMSLARCRFYFQPTSGTSFTPPQYWLALSSSDLLTDVKIVSPLEASVDWTNVSRSNRSFCGNSTVGINAEEFSSVEVIDSSWDSKPIVLGGYYLWVDSTGALRIKLGEPASDTDGVTVGSQS